MISDIVNSLLLLTAVVTIIISIKQSKKNAQDRLAIAFKELYYTYFNDESIRSGFYKVEWGDFKFEDGFADRDTEKHIDSLLCFSETICVLYDRSIISDSEMGYFEYRFKRIWHNGNIQDYFSFLDDFYKKHNVSKKPFEAFRKYCENNLKMEQL